MSASAAQGGHKETARPILTTPGPKAEEQKCVTSYADLLVKYHMRRMTGSVAPATGC